MAKNTLVTIGYLGNKRAYLNLSKEEALATYCAAEYEGTPTPEDLSSLTITEFEFENEFCVYEAWA